MSVAGILLVGGYGAVGGAAARALRAAHPGVPLLIAGRRPAAAQRLADELGNADALPVDVTRDDLALSAELDISAVAMFVKDKALNGFQAAARRSVPYLTMSEYAFDVAPILLSWAQAAPRIPVALLGHHLGGLATLAAIRHSQDLSAVTDIHIGALFDDDDLGSSTARADAELASVASPRPLIRRHGSWTWRARDAVRTEIRAEDGEVHRSEPISLLDTVSVGAATGAADVVVHVAVRPAGPHPRHEVTIDITGSDRDGSRIRRRVLITDRAHHVRLSGIGAAMALTRLIGLDGSPAPGPGLHLPETLLDSRVATDGLVGLGARVEVMQQRG